MSGNARSGAAAGDPEHGRDRRTWLSVDLVAITDDSDDPALVLYPRERDPHAGDVSLPGAVMDPARGMTVAQTAAWIAEERAHAAVVDGTEPHAAVVVSDPRRDERGHTVSLVTVARVCTPAADSPVVLVRAGEKVPPRMPFGHNAMLADAARRAYDGLLTDPGITHALVSDTAAHGVTGSGLWSLLRLLHQLAGGDPKQSPTADAVRRRASRSALIVPAGKVAAVTRPETVFISAGVR